MPDTSFTRRSDALAALEPNRADAAPSRRLRVLLEMRPALDGYAGIPQETRLLFRGLRTIDNLSVAGMIQSSTRALARGTRPGARGRMHEARRLNRYSRVIVSLAERANITLFEKFIAATRKSLAASSLTVSSLSRLRSLRLTDFDPTHFADFIWGSLFSKSLPAADHPLVTGADFKVCTVPWRTMHQAGLYTLNVSRSPVYPRLDTRGIDVFIAQTPYPARVHRDTALVVRYHDAVPVFMPHTIADKSMHQATHFYALLDNVKSGGWFACVSEATRQDLLKLFPEVEARAVTIHNMVSGHYFVEPEAPARIPQIIRTRLYQPERQAPGELSLAPPFSAREQDALLRRRPGAGGLRYLLVVSTIEPRKNHACLLAAWEEIKAHTDQELKLVVVGQLGWGHTQIAQKFKPWIERGELFALNAVPADDLRVLYRNAAATVCPSVGEGFDFSGVEAMASNGVVIASDIPAHREVYADGADYFNPYSTESLAGVIRSTLYGPDAAQRQAVLRRRGIDIAARYRPERILPQWSRFLERVATTRTRQSTSQ
jgi:hypothetical protein